MARRPIHRSGEVLFTKWRDSWRYIRADSTGGAGRARAEVLMALDVALCTKISHSCSAVVILKTHYLNSVMLSVGNNAPGGKLLSLLSKLFPISHLKNFK